MRDPRKNLVIGVQPSTEDRRREKHSHGHPGSDVSCIRYDRCGKRSIGHRHGFQHQFAWGPHDAEPTGREHRASGGHSGEQPLVHRTVGENPVISRPKNPRATAPAGEFAGTATIQINVANTQTPTKSLIVTTNLPFENWTEVLGSERLTGAALDRLTHRCHILETKGESYRLQDAKRRRRRTH